MSVTVQAPPHAAAAERPAYRISGRRVLRAEWSKLWSLRSTWITLAVALLALVVFGWIAAASYSPTGTVHGPGADAHDAVALSLGGIDFAQLAIGVLGVLITAGEYSTGMIRSTMAAVPRRLPVLWSKAGVYFGVLLLPVLAAVFVSFLIGERALSGSAVSLGLSSPGVARSLLGAAVYLALAGVLGAALGMLLRSVAGGIGVHVFVLLLLGELVGLLPHAFSDRVGPYLPGKAGGAAFALTHGSGTLGPGAGLAVFAGWVALALAAAACRLRRSDV